MWYQRYTSYCLLVVPQCSAKGGVVAQCAHASIFLECSPNFYPGEWPPQNHVSEMYGLRGGVCDHIFEHRAANWTNHTKRALHISNKFIPNPHHRCHLFQAGLEPHGGRHHHAYCWAHISSAFANPAACGSSLVPSLYAKVWSATAVALAVVKIWCSLWVHAGCCDLVARAFFAWLCVNLPLGDPDS